MKRLKIAIALLALWPSLAFAGGHGWGKRVSQHYDEEPCHRSCHGYRSSYRHSRYHRPVAYRQARPVVYVEPAPAVAVGVAAGILTGVLVAEALSKR